MTAMVAKEDQRAFDLQILKKQLSSGQIISLNVASDSMHPLLKVGELIKVEKVSKRENLQVFDLIVFDQGGRLNVHFLAKADHSNQEYITQCLKYPGQNDYPLKPEQIMGRVLNKKLSLWQKMKVLLVK